MEFDLVEITIVRDAFLVDTILYNHKSEYVKEKEI